MPVHPPAVYFLREHTVSKVNGASGVNDGLYYTKNLPVGHALCAFFSDETRRQGLTVILDARKGPWKTARSCIRQISSSMNCDELAHFVVLRPENFLDKQRVETCTNIPKDGQVSPRKKTSEVTEHSPRRRKLLLYSHYRCNYLYVNT